MSDYLSRIEEIMEEKRRKDPLKQEQERLLNEIFPIQAVNDMYLLGYCNAFVALKKDFYKYFSDDDKVLIDELIKTYRKEDKKMDNFLGKLLNK